MIKASELNITSFTFISCDPRHYIGNICLQSGGIQKPTWRGLHRYWNFARYSEIEYMAGSFSNHYAIFCFTVASGQGGVIAVWDTCPKRWMHVSEACYVSCAMYLEEIPAVVSLHYISCWGVPGHHSLFVTPMNRTLQGHDNVSVPIKASYSEHGFDVRENGIQKAAYGDYAENAYGPLGIFLLEDGNTILAHDSGNCYQTSIAAVRKALE